MVMVILVLDEWKEILPTNSGQDNCIQSVTSYCNEQDPTNYSMIC